MELKYLAALGICISLYSLCYVSGIDLGFDYFVYTQQHPETLCLKTLAKKVHCSIPQNVTTWIVHGLWPTKNGSHHGPYNCNATAEFDISKLRSIEAIMWKYWPNLFESSTGDIYEFWEHEWYKHGTCGLHLNATSSEYLYFNTGLKLQTKVNLDKIMSDAGILMSDTKTYPLEKVTAALQNAIGKKAALKCYIFNKEQYLWQFEVCMDTKFQFINCLWSESTCSKKYRVKYPVIKHPYLKDSYNIADKGYNMLKQL